MSPFPSCIAFIPARSGSLRVPWKNIRTLCGHPLIAYTIAVARQSGIFSRIIVSTNSEEIQKISLYYGAEAPFLRPEEFATSTSPDIEWLTHAFSKISEPFDCFAILRPTSPLRTTAMIQRALHRFVILSKTHHIDSIRAVELCKQHPGKMWVLEGEIIKPFIDQSHLEVPWHARQYQDLPKVYIQNSSLEIAWARVVTEYHSREGRIIAPFFTEKWEGFAIDYPYDWEILERAIEKGEVSLPRIDKKPYGSHEL